MDPLVCYKLGDWGMATLRTGRWHVADGDARYLSQEMLDADYSALDKVGGLRVGTVEAAGGA